MIALELCEPTNNQACIYASFNFILDLQYVRPDFDYCAKQYLILRCSQPRIEATWPIYANLLYVTLGDLKI
jgi:hypothetical protein